MKSPLHKDDASERAKQERRRLREERRFWKAVADFVVRVELHIIAVDAQMQLPSDVNRGKRIAELLNSLEMSKDILKRFTLDMDLRKPASRQLKLKRPAVSP